MKKPMLLILSVGITVFCFAQENFWKFESDRSVLTVKKNTPQLINPRVYRILSLPFDQYKAFLNTAPTDVLPGVKNGIIISLPYPDNSFKKFRITETSMMEDALAAQFSGIKTYAGQGIDDPAATVRIDYTLQGFHAYVISPSGSLFIDPYQQANNNLYITYFSKDYINPEKEKFKCTLDSRLPNNHLSRPAGASSTEAPLTGTCIGNQLRTYRVAISCTGEYAIAVCPAGSVTVANTLSAIVTTMNRINGVYQTEVDIKMILVGAEASLIYTNPATDPYSGNDDASTLIDESQLNITSVIGSSAFDVGQTFSTGAGGLASVGAACNNNTKAEGVTGLASPVGDAYDIDYVAHEIGHEFGATHPFESEEGNCGGGNRERTSAYEPGSGTTIMSYSGICGSDNIQSHSDPYFHSKSFDQIVAYTTTGNGNTCPVVTATGNHSPVVSMPVSGMIIPKGTPFTLTGSANDVDGDAITYSWEEWDLSNSNKGSAWNSGANSTVTPLFKARPPKISASRTFPDMAVILANYPSNPDSVMDGLKGETLPQVSRNMKFRLVARDNKANGGGVATGGDGCSSTATFNVVVAPEGPFKLTSPNTAVNWLGGTTQTVTWDVVNTDASTGSNVKNIDILMSTDGGITYPTSLVSNTPNNGSATITVPNIPTNNKVRFMAKALGNIFFDISDVNFTVTFNAVLPSILQFSVSPVDNAISLTWSTTTESNNKGFEVLRSQGNDSNFLAISFTAGAGNSNVLKNYAFTDNTVKKGITYFYRLQLIDVNDSSLYSLIKSAKINSTGIFSAIIQPQPFDNAAELYLDGIEKKDFNIIISDMLGRVIMRKQIKNTEQSRLIPVNLDQEASGIYVVKFIQDSLQKTIKAVKR